MSDMSEADNIVSIKKNRAELRKNARGRDDVMSVHPPVVRQL